MSAIASTSSASPFQPLTKRRDVDVHSQRQSGQRVYRIKDPLSLKYYQLSEAEYFIWCQLEQCETPENLLAAFHGRFPGRQLEHRELNRFIQRLLANGLLNDAGHGTATRFIESNRRQQKSAWLNHISNLLVVRLPGIRPQRFLDWLCPKLDWVFTRQTMVAALGLIGVGTVAFTLRALAVSPTVFQIQSLLAPDNLIWLSCVLAVTKVAHELGHAVACRRVGAQCHEMGVMLLALTPCLYCDVTDTWTVPSKWKRIGVSGAGIVVDILFASVSALIWSCTEPGLLNSICLNIVVVCSISTLIFNGNPLMRYDGYYMLQDLVEVPNLRQVASSWSRHVLVRWFTGIEVLRERDRPARGRLSLFAYGLASGLYITVVTVSILLVVRSVLKSYGLTPVADVVTALTIFRMFCVPLFQSVKSFANQGRHQMHWSRSTIRGGLATALLAIVLFVPLPHRLTVAATLLPRNACFVFPSVAGELDELVESGQRVQAGDHLVVLRDARLDFEVARVTGLRDRQDQHVKSLQNRQFDDVTAAAELPGSKERLESLNNELKKRVDERNRLQVASPIDGIVYAVPSSSGSGRDGRSESLDHNANPGQFVSMDTLLCVVGEPDQWEAVLTVDQDSVGQFQTKQSVRLRGAQAGMTTIDGTVVEVSKADALASRFDVDSRLPNDDPTQLLKATYQVRVSLDQPPPLLLGPAGDATVTVAPTPLFSRVVNYVRRTFTFRR